jgi:uncharacterized protein (DUF58 family)
VTGNFVPICMALGPLLLLAFGIWATSPKTVIANRNDSKGTAWVGEIIEVSWDVTLPKGVGVITLNQELPNNFELAEGNNLKVMWKRSAEQSLIFSFKMKCSKRGLYKFSKLNWEWRHPLGIIQTRFGEAGEDTQLLVRPRVLNIRRIRGTKGVAPKSSPGPHIVKVGVPGTDFRELRQYMPGDSVRSINWKATARLAGRGLTKPVVNEYEAEGKKTVLIFLDTSSYMEVGTSIRNVFEYSMEAASGMAHYFLDSGYRVGVYSYGADGHFNYPDTGKRQFFQISRTLATLKISKDGGNLVNAVEKCRRHIQGRDPFCIVVTRLDSGLPASLITGVEKMALLRGRMKTALPIMIVGIAGYSAVTLESEYERNTVNLLHLWARPVANYLRKAGVSVLDWDPSKENFANALLRGMKVK